MEKETNSRANKFDVIVVGAGPAGSSAAITAQKNGLKVAIIDKQAFPRNKLCAALFSGRALRSMKCVFSSIPNDSYFLNINSVTFKWGGTTIRNWTNDHKLRLSYRHDVDHWLLKLAIKSGVSDFQKVQLSKIDEENCTIELKDGRILHYNVLIGADGANSIVGRHLFGRPFDPNTIGFALETEAPEECDENADLSIDFDCVRPGYGWSFPKIKSRTIGVAALHKANPKLKSTMSKYLHSENIQEKSVNVKGAFIPLGDYHKLPGRNEILLAGDAAGLVDGLTGEGIAYAIESGAKAAEAATSAISSNTPCLAFEYYLPLVKEHHKELDIANRIRAFAYGWPFRKRFRKALENHPTMHKKFFDLLEGNASYCDIEAQINKKVLSSLMKLPNMLKYTR